MAFKIKSENSLLQLAEFYCSKRETSRIKLGRYLQRKCMEQKIDPLKYPGWIVNVLDACEKTRMVDDARYAEILIRDYTDRGKGRKYVENKLKEKGIPKDLQNVPDDVDAELGRAIKLANKSMKNLQSKVTQKINRDSRRTKSPKTYRPKINENFELKQKLMQKLLSSGFSLEIAKKTVQTCLQKQT